MNYNQFSKLDLITKPINSRAKLDTGTHCNYACNFCYYYSDLNKVTDFETIKKRIDIIQANGIKEIDLSGGESSIHKDWFKILDYCNERFESVSCLSNGYKFSDFMFAQEAKQHGLSEVLFSLHGWNADSHDQIVSKKHAFDNMIVAILNCNILGIKVRLNCTVTDFNASHLVEYTNMIKEYDIKQINFLPLNYWEDAVNTNPSDYNILSKGIKEGIDNLQDTDIQINVRYIPFCFMEGYEKYVVGIYQHIFDLNDWNIIAYDNELHSSFLLGDYYKKAKENRVNSYNKDKECYDCKYFHICDGLEHKISRIQDVYPVTGDKLFDPMFYRTGDRV